MAELVSIKRNVDVSPGQAAPAVFHCSQGDVGSKIILGLLNNGTAYAIPSGVTVTIEGSESNGSIFTPISATVSGSDITFYLTGEMTAVAGPAICQAVLKSGSNILGTANFTLEVESSPMGADAPPVFTDAGWTWMLNKLNTEFVPALGDNIIDAIDSKADQSDLTALSNTVAGHTGSITVLNNTVNTLNRSVAENRQNIATKLDKNQGTTNAGKYLKVGADGNVETVTTDKTLSIADKAADAKAVGDELDDLKADLSESKSNFFNQLQPNYRIVATKGASANTSGEYIPFIAHNGDSITAYTADGNDFVNVQLRFYDADKQYIAYWTLASGYGKTRTFTYNEATAYYVSVHTVNISSSNDYVVINNSNPYLQKITEIESAENNLATDVVRLQTMYYQTFITKNDGKIPFNAHNGDVIATESIDGNTFANDQLRFYDANGNYLDYWGMTSSYGKRRTFTYNLQTDAYYISIQQVSGNNYKYHVTNKSNPYYREKYNSLSILKYLSDNKNDIKSLKKNADVNFMFFSDIHSGETNLSRIIEFAENVGNVSAVINGGDTVQSFVSDSVTWYDTIVNASTVPVLNCIGNHDMWSSYWVSADKKTVYDKFIAPVANNVSSIVQPEGASTNGLNYYYVDFNNVRIIILAGMVTDSDTMYWNSSQKTWLESVLDDAKTNDMFVVCVNHSPFKKSDAVINYNSPLNSWMTFNTSYFDAIHLSPEAVTAVNSFINGGGKFICWLTGHTHNDYIMTEEIAPSQFMINIASAKYSNHSDGYSPSNTEISERNYDCFNMIGIDTANQLLKVVRIGYNEDASMKIRSRFCYDFQNATIISNS